MRPLNILILAFLLSAANATRTLAAIQFTTWNLRDSVSDSSGPHAIQDFNIYNTITNPWILSSVSQVGLNVNRVDYDYTWLTDGSFGTFNTAFAQTFRTQRLREVSTATLRFQMTEDVLCHVTSVMSYSHTPGAENFIRWTVGIGNADSSVFAQFHGGNGYVLPSSGTFVMDETFVLHGGANASFNFGLDTDNLGGGLPASTMDISGFLKWSFTPVPEPSSLALILTGSPVVFRPRRRCGIPPGGRPE